MEFLKELLIITIFEIVCLVGSIVVVGFILGFFRERSIKNFYKAFGRKSIYITGFIGVPIHELSHAIVAIIFRHEITEIKLFKPSSEDNTLGYVKHRYNTKSIYQQIGNFFIGIAPILGGTISIGILMYFLIPSVYNVFMSTILNNINQVNLINVVLSFKELTKLVFTLDNFKNVEFIIFILLAICISSHISLSKADIKGASKGLFSMFLILIILNLLGITKYVSINMIISYNMLIINILFIAIIFSFITYMISLIISSIFK
ncbi:hypothetical protein E5347_10090 [Clostridium sartagoforme]|uniref:Uncharacterized protein n=1 Tax=Clostridium sartagoforme TaxID=84031 RepID=A0A4S2DIT0_9CLOT|nr:hypothetical protein [Clostridium sartagoforme]TGY42077.1 hypothetical protein E5347_10090 [Clostridium sartagoforme]